MFYLHGETARCAAVPALLQAVLLQLHSGEFLVIVHSCTYLSSGAAPRDAVRSFLPSSGVRGIPGAVLSAGRVRCSGAAWKICC